MAVLMSDCRADADSYPFFLSCLRNVVTLFHFIEKERAWRKQNGLPEGFDTIRKVKPIGELVSCKEKSKVR